MNNNTNNKATTTHKKRKKHTKFWFRFISLVVAIFMIFMSLMYLFTAFSPAASAATLNDQLSSAQKKQREVEKKLKQETSEAKQIETKIKSIESKIATVNADIISMEAQIVEKTEQIKESEELIELKIEAYKEIIKTIYEEGEAPNNNIILGSENMIQFTYNSILINDILEYEKEIIDSIEEEQIKLENAKKIIVANKAKIQQQKNVLASSKLELDAQKAKQAAIVAELRKREQALEDKIADIGAELSKTTSRGTGYSSENLIWPISGYTSLSSGYGSRWGTIHGGIDIPAPAGTIVRAVAGGTVKMASPLSSGANWSYGNFVMIDHGNGFSTLYAHGSALLCSTGQAVSQGQAILKVGSTGNSTGNHLHFETRKNGVRVNPIGNYYNKK